MPRETGTRAGKPLLEDGRTLDATNVIWCTGFDAGLSWIDLPIFDERGEPKHERGLVPSEPGISFVGQQFLYAMSSTMIHGVARDAERIANAIGVRMAPTTYRTDGARARMVATPARIACHRHAAHRLGSQPSSSPGWGTSPRAREPLRSPEWHRRRHR